MASKEDLKHLIDQLPEGKLDNARAILISLLRGDTLDSAPLDDEPTTDEDIAAVREGRAEFEREETISSAEARRRLLG